MSRPGTGTVLATVAIVLAVLAPLAGRAAPAEVGVEELRRDLASGRPFVDAVTVAEWIRDRRGLRILDVRPDSGAHVRFSIPTAAHVPFGALPDRAGDTTTTIVLYDDGGGEAVRGWLLLRRLVHPDVRILEGGVVGWIDGVISPMLPRGTPEERARYRRVADVSRYFGGLPRVGTPPPRETDAEAAVQLLSRRGCY